MALTPWPGEVLEYCRVAAHVHSQLPLEPECAKQLTACTGQLTVQALIDLATQLGWKGVVFAEHTSNPAAPTLLTSGSLLRAVRQQIAAIRQENAARGIALFPGLETNILPDGRVDGPESLLRGAGFIIASHHGGLGAAEKDPGAIEQRLKAVCDNPWVDAIGHPTRHNDEAAVNWAAVCAYARDTNTVLELNLNLWFKNGPGQTPKDNWQPQTWAWYRRQTEFWLEWLQVVAESGVAVLVSLDAHNSGMVPGSGSLEAWATPLAKLVEFTRLLRGANIPPSRSINGSLDRFRQWSQPPKAKRSLVW